MFDGMTAAKIQFVRDRDQRFIVRRERAVA